MVLQAMLFGTATLLGTLKTGAINCFEKWLVRFVIFHLHLEYSWP